MARCGWPWVTETEPNAIGMATVAKTTSDRELERRASTEDPKDCVWWSWWPKVQQFLCVSYKISMGYDGLGWVRKLILLSGPSGLIEVDFDEIQAQLDPWILVPPRYFSDEPLDVLIPTTSVPHGMNSSYFGWCSRGQQKWDTDITWHNMTY